MFVKHGFSTIIIPLVFAAILAAAPNVQSAKTVEAETDAIHGSWSFNLTLDT